MRYHLNTRTVTSSLLAGVFSLSYFSMGLPAAAELLPHRAVYELSLIGTERDSGIEDASGLFVFQVTGASCTGWTMNSSMALGILSRTGNALQTETDYQAFEAPAGDIFTYETNSHTSGEAPSLVAGAAQRIGSGALSMRRLSEDEQAASAAVGTLFPNQLTQAVLDAAETGETLFFSSVFDGSHASGQAQAVTAVIGERTRPSLVAPVRAEGRLNLDDEMEQLREDGLELWEDFDRPVAAWPVLLSYFDPLEPDSAPSFQVAYSLDSNGVSDDVLLHYSSFSLRGVLSDFTPFRPSVCPD